MLNLTLMTCRYIGTRTAEMQMISCYVIKTTIYSGEKQKEDQRRGKKKKGKYEKL